MPIKSPAYMALSAAIALAGCSSGIKMPSVGSINPFGKANAISETDRVFLMAAGSWDRNKDNTVTCDEWKEYANELFTGADANGDGSLEQSEWGSMSKTDRMFDTADLDYFDASNDGKVTNAEFTGKENPAFRLLDVNKTCSLAGDQVAGARSKTEYDLAAKAKPKEEDKGQGTPDAPSNRRY